MTTMEFFSAIRKEELKYNHGICPRCESQKLKKFDEDPQGGRGYKCNRCGYVTWVYNDCVDRDYDYNDVTSNIHVDISDIGEDLIGKLNELLNAKGYEYRILSKPSLIEVDKIDRVVHIYFNKEEK
jgi:hypothetical protein